METQKLPKMLQKAVRAKMREYYQDDLIETTAEHSARST